MTRLAVLATDAVTAPVALIVIVACSVHRQKVPRRAATITNQFIVQVECHAGSNEIEADSVILNKELHKGRKHAPFGRKHDRTRN